MWFIFNWYFLIVPVSFMNIIDTLCKLLNFIDFSHFIHQGTIQAQKPIISLNHREVTRVAKVREHIANTLLVFLCIVPYVCVVSVCTCVMCP